jgi:carbonic anhydrase
MTELDKIVDANKQYFHNFKHGNLSIPPARKLAVLACMDARLNVNEALGLKTGDAHIIRNAGGIATEDAIRSLIISHELLGTQEFVVINHTDCGMLTFTDNDLQKDLRQKYKSDASEIRFYSFPNLEENVNNQINEIKSSPFFPPDIPIHGFIYDVKTGKIERIAGAQKTINEISIQSSSP